MPTGRCLRRRGRWPTCAAAGEGLGRPAAQVVPALAGALEAVVREVLATGRPVAERKVAAETPDGEWLLSAYPLKSAEGPVRYVALETMPASAAGLHDEMTRLLASLAENSSDLVGFAWMDETVAFLNPRRAIGLALDADLSGYRIADSRGEIEYPPVQGGDPADRPARGPLGRARPASTRSTRPSRCWCTSPSSSSPRRARAGAWPSARSAATSPGSAATSRRSASWPRWWRNSPDFIGFAADWYFAFLNPAGRRLVGLEPDEDISQYHISDFRTPEEHQRYIDEIYPILEARTVTGRASGRCAHLRTGREIPVQQTTFVVVEPGTNRRLGYASVCRDITERRRIEETLRRSEYVLAEGQRLSHTGSWTWSSPPARSSGRPSTGGCSALRRTEPLIFQRFLERIHPRRPGGFPARARASRLQREGFPGGVPHPAARRQRAPHLLLRHPVRGAGGDGGKPDGASWSTSPTPSWRRKNCGTRRPACSRRRPSWPTSPHDHDGRAGRFHRPRNQPAAGLDRQQRLGLPAAAAFRRAAGGEGGSGRDRPRCHRRQRHHLPHPRADQGRAAGDGLRRAARHPFRRDDALPGPAGGKAHHRRDAPAARAARAYAATGWGCSRCCSTSSSTPSRRWRVCPRSGASSTFTPRPGSARGRPVLVVCVEDFGVGFAPGEEDRIFDAFPHFQAEGHGHGPAHQPLHRRGPRRAALGPVQPRRGRDLLLLPPGGKGGRGGDGVGEGKGRKNGMNGIFWKGLTECPLSSLVNSVIPSAFSHTLVPKLHLGTGLWRQLRCRSIQREMEFRAEQENVPK